MLFHFKLRMKKNMIMVLKENSKHYSAIKLCASIILLSFACLFLHTLSASLSLVLHMLAENTNVPSPFSGFYNLTSKETLTAKGSCDLSSGKWIPSDMEPLYTSETCSFIDDTQNCLMNGRMDTGYLHWRWKPHGCELPRFDPRRFLESMRDKVLGMIGDSISRNHAGSLMCMLSKVEEATLIYHDEGYRCNKWFFRSYNFTISVIWSPFLAKSDVSQDSSSEDELHLDLLDNVWTENYTSFTHLIFSTGPWFPRPTIYYENNTITGCNRCSTDRNLTDLGLAHAHRKVLRKVYDHIVSSNYKGSVIYRTTSASHFEYAEWNAGGMCNRTVPAKAGELKPNEDEMTIHDIELEEFDRASRNGVNVKLFDVSYLSLLRPDGHPGLYRYGHKHWKAQKGNAISDCLHWCLPGPIDYWNDLLIEMLL